MLMGFSEQKELKDRMMRLYDENKTKLLELLREGLVSDIEYDEHLKFLDQCKAAHPKRDLDLAGYVGALKVLERDRMKERGLDKKSKMPKLWTPTPPPSSPPPPPDRPRPIRDKYMKSGDKAAGRGIVNSEPPEPPLLRRSDNDNNK